MLRYLHLTGILLGVHRLREHDRMRDAETALKRSNAATAEAVEAARHSFNADAVSSLFDRWSLHNLVKLARYVLITVN